MTKLAPEWVRTNDPVIRSPARYRWNTAPALHNDRRAITASGHDYALDRSAIGAGYVFYCETCLKETDGIFCSLIACCFCNTGGLMCT